MVKNLYVSVIEISGLPDKASFWASTDPYVRCTVGANKEQTSFKKRAGGRAIFHESYTLPLTTTDCLIEILDKATMSKDSVLARGIITVKARDGYCYLGPVSLEDCSGKDLSPSITLALSVHDD